MSAAPPLVLIVEDEPDICWALARILTGMGYGSEVAATGAAAEQRIGASAFSLALVDAKLPDLDGTKLIAHLRELQPGLPIILISAYFYEHDQVVQSLTHDGQIIAFVSKPFRHDTVCQAIRRALPAASAAPA